MKRRDFLLSSVLTALGFSVSSSVFPGSLSRSGGPYTGLRVASDSLHELRALFSNPEHAEAIGRAYLETQQAAVRWDALAKGAGLDLRSPHIPMREHIRKRSSEDFAQGNTVVVNGWVLAKTEACACALLTLA